MNTTAIRSIGPADVPPATRYLWRCLTDGCAHGVLSQAILWAYDSEEHAARGGADHVARTRHTVSVESFTIEDAPAPPLPFGTGIHSIGCACETCSITREADAQ